MANSNDDVELGSSYVRLQDNEEQTSDNNDNQKQLEQKTVLLSYGLMVISAILFSSLAVLIQYGFNLGYPSGQLLAFRGFIQILIIIVTIIYNKEYNEITENYQKMNKYNKLWAVLRGLFGSSAGLGYFLAICVLPMGDAIATFSVYPLVCILFGWIILHEPIKMIHFGLMIVSIIGVFLLSQPDFLLILFERDDDHIDSIYYIIPIIGAVFAGLSFISMRKSKNTHIKILVLSYSIFSFVAGILSTVIYHRLHAFDNDVLFKFVGLNGWNDIKQWLVLLSMGIVGYFAQTTMTYSAQKLPAGVSSFIRSSDIIWSYIFDMIFFNQIPSIITVIGAVLILISIAGICVLKYLKTKNENKDVIIKEYDIIHRL